MVIGYFSHFFTHPYVCVCSRELSQSDLMDDIVGSTEAEIFFNMNYFLLKTNDLSPD